MNQSVIRARFLCSTVAVLALAFLSGELALPAAAGEQPEPAAVAPAEEAANPGGEPSAEKRRKAMAGLMAVAGIMIVGVAFAAIVIIWGARLRRLARRELPPQTTLQNDLWFLKPPKSNGPEDQ